MISDKYNKYGQYELACRPEALHIDIPESEVSEHVSEIIWEPIQYQIWGHLTDLIEEA